MQFLLSWDGPLLCQALLASLAAFAITGLASDLPYFKVSHPTLRLFLLGISLCWQDFCLTMAASLAMLLFLGLTLFATILYLTGRREAAGLKCFHFWRRGDTHFPRLPHSLFSTCFSQ